MTGSKRPQGTLTPSSLGEKIRRQIAATGPISVADYMSQCLADPEFGYYMTKDPFGKTGDFITAPEISQMFGELIGGWCIETWRRLSKPSTFNLIEMGPGRGTLMSDILRIAALEPEFLAAMRLHLVETSPHLRIHQQKTLKDAPADAHWHDTLETVPDAPTILVANELFDALPIRQFVFQSGRWRERVVGLDENGALVFGLGAGTLDDKALPGSVAGFGEGSLVETSPAAMALVETISHRLLKDGGSALFIDYGYTKFATGDTLQAVRAHEPTGPLDEPGHADLTAHVNFDAVARAAKGAGALCHGPLEQGAFLLKLGLLQRAGQLGSGKDHTTQERIRADVERLAGPEQMGALFKVIALSPAGLKLPGFED